MMTGIIVRLPDGYQTLYSGDTLTIGDLRLEVLVTSAGVHLNVLSDAPDAPAPRETDGARLARMGTDGAKWAAEWRRIARQLLIDRGMYNYNADGDLTLLDEGWMIGWFANAIEAGRAEGYRQGREEGTQRVARGQLRETHPEEWVRCAVHDHHFPISAMDGRPCTPTTSRLADVDETAGGT